jgi:hypothetical protein
VAIGASRPPLAARRSPKCGVSSAVEHLPYKQGVTGSNPVPRTIPEVNFTLLPQTFAIVRMTPADEIPGWAAGGQFVSITRTAEELSIVCRETAVPAGTHADRGWQCLKLEGPIPLNTVGVAAELTTILARAGVSVFPIATYDTDYVLIKGDCLARAEDALRSAGHSVRR